MQIKALDRIVSEVAGNAVQHGRCSRILAKPGLKDNTQAALYANARGLVGYQ